LQVILLKLSSGSGNGTRFGESGGNPPNGWVCSCTPFKVSLKYRTPAMAVQSGVIFQVASPKPAYEGVVRESVRPKKVLPPALSASSLLELLNGPFGSPRSFVVITCTSRSCDSCSRYPPTTKLTGKS